jgi:pimeloyl-ACP methyl ester carboxylesterase
MKTIYKDPNSKEKLLQLYDQKLSDLDIEFEELDIKTSYGNTRVIKTGNPDGEKVVLFHGINAGAPLTLEATKGLRYKYELFAIDTIGQANKSDETTLDIADESYAIWADEVVNGLQISHAHFIGISYGAYILQKLITHKPDNISKSIMIVPSGLVNGAAFPSLTKLSFPLFKYKLTKSDKHLRQFIKAFVPDGDEFMFEMQRALLSGVKIDFRRPHLLQAKNVEHFHKPVYIMVAEDDIFFPGNHAIARARAIFKNLREVHILKGSKHMPTKSQHAEIEQVISEWLLS